MARPDQNAYVEGLLGMRARRESHGPTVMESVVVAGDMTVRQVKHFAESAQKAWEDFQNAHARVKPSAAVRTVLGKP